jgi:acetyl esterase/lipase
MSHNVHPSSLGEPRRLLGAWPRLVLAIVLAGCLLAFSGTPGTADPPRAKTATKKLNGHTVPDGVSIDENVVYCTVKKGKLKLGLDVAFPKKGNQSLATIVLFHGMGPANKGRKGLTGLLLELAQKGYVVLAVQYRCPNDAPYPAAMEDVTAAMNWLRANAAKYRIDKDRVGVLGFSGGATLACMLALKKPDLVRAVVSYFAPTNLVQLHKEAVGIKGYFIRKSLEAMFGGSPDKKMKNYKEASPVNYVRKEAAPILFLHGEADDVVPPQHSKLLYKKLRQKGANANYLAFAHAPHDFDGVPKSTNALVAATAAEAFLKEKLKARPPVKVAQK